MIPVRMNMASVFVTIGLLASCDHAPHDVVREDTGDPETEKGIAEPRPAPMGSLGGPCGINFSKCPTADDVVRVFRGLKKTSVRSAVDATQTEFTSRFRIVSIRFQVPRLVNDHRGSRDHLEVIAAETGYDTVFPREGTGSLHIKRNNATVAQIWMSRDDSGLQPKHRMVDTTRGGVEAVYTFFLDRNLVRHLEGGLDRTLYPDPNAADPNSSCSFNDNCAWCRATKAAGVALIAWAAFEVGAVVGTAWGSSVAGAGAGIGNFFEESLDCGDNCKRGECKVQYCQCRMSGGSDCAKDFKDCCESNGGMFSHCDRCNASYCASNDFWGN